MKKGPGASSFGKWALVFLAIFIVVFAFLVMQIYDCFRYRAIYENPLAVEAEVTSHGEGEDSDGYAEYYNYISYEAMGEHYRDIRYSTVADESALLPLGSRFWVQVNPNDPAELMENVASAAVVLFFLAFCTILLAIILWNRRASLSVQKAESVPPREEIAHELKRLIYLRSGVPCFLASGLVLAGLILVFPMIFPSWLWIAVLVLFFGFLLCARVSARDLSAVLSGEFSVSRGEVREKRIEKGDEGEIIYTLVYVFGDRVVDRSVTRAEYSVTGRGATQYAVFLPNKDRPSLYYR